MSSAVEKANLLAEELQKVFSIILEGDTALTALQFVSLLGFLQMGSTLRLHKEEIFEMLLSPAMLYLKIHLIYCFPLRGNFQYEF